jgi:DNA-binding transcriptional LysR family regulator
MEMHQLRCFLAAVNELNFTPAAEARHISQPALQQLEKELGGLLFRRERAGASPPSSAG